MEENKNTNNNKEKELKEKKRGPGRPPNAPTREPTPRKGISDKPVDQSNFIELLYDYPIIFKKLWSYYRAMAVEKLQIIFRPEDIIIWGEDHHKKSVMRTKINTKKINHYYCTQYLEIGVMCSNLEKITSTIDKSFNSISIMSKRGYTQKNIKVNLTTDIEIEKNHTIELIGDYPKLESEDIFLDNDYKIKFELPWKYFKKMITDLKTFSEQITIRQDDKSEPLVFDYITKDKTIKSKEVVRNNKKIKFLSSLKDDESFRASFKVDYIKPISSALLTEKITICVHENKPIMFIINIDNGAIEIKILTEIIDGRKKMI